MDLEKTINKKFRSRSTRAEDLQVPFDYKDARRLEQYMTERGKILPRRITGLPRVKQKELEQAIKRARKLALVPYTVHEVRIDWR